MSSLEWEFIDMSEQEEDLIYRMYKLVGDRCDRIFPVGMGVFLFSVAFLKRGMVLETRWALIAGRIPGRKAEEIERFWIMRHGEVFADRRRHHQKLLLWRETSPDY